MEFRWVDLYLARVCYDLWIFVGFDRVSRLVNENYQIFLKLQNGKLKTKN